MTDIIRTIGIAPEKLSQNSKRMTYGAKKNKKRLNAAPTTRVSKERQIRTSPASGSWCAQYATLGKSVAHMALKKGRGAFTNASAIEKCPAATYPPKGSTSGTGGGT